MTRIFFNEIKALEPRPGVTYATEYLIQHRKDRVKLKQHVGKLLEQLAILQQSNPSIIDELQKPDTRFRKSRKGEYYTQWEIIEDMYKESIGRKKDGTPKDFAMAPIGRWNRLFKGTDTEIILDSVDNRSQYNEVFKNDAQF